MHQAAVDLANSTNGGVTQYSRADKDRPVNVTFEWRAIDDRTKAEETGVTSRDVIIAKIRQPGDKYFETEVFAEEWVARNERQRVPFAEFYRAQLEAFKREDEAPEYGLSLKIWPLIRPAELESCLRLGIKSVEALANVSDSDLPKIGPGANALKARAIEYMGAREGAAVAEGVAKLKEEMEAIQLSSKEKDAMLEEAFAEIRELTKALKEKQDGNAAGDTEKRVGRGRGSKAIDGSNGE